MWTFRRSGDDLACGQDIDVAAPVYFGQGLAVRAERRRSGVGVLLALLAYRCDHVDFGVVRQGLRALSR